MKSVRTLHRMGLSSYFLSRGIYWLVLAMMFPLIIAYVQTSRTAQATVKAEADRVIDFFISEVDQMLSSTERVMDTYIHNTQGSCAASDLAFLRRHMTSHGNLLSMGVIAADGKIACALGEGDLEAVTFPKVDKQSARKPQFAELRNTLGSLPVLIKQGNNDVRTYAVIARDRFSSLLLPGLLTDYAQIDIILPKGGLWYSVTGKEVSHGFSNQTIKVERTSDRFPIALSLVLDKSAAKRWSGSLRTTLIVISLICAVTLLSLFIGNWVYRFMVAGRIKRDRMRVVERAQSLFEITYQPVLNFDSNLLVGVIARADLSIFDSVPEDRPSVDEIIETVWGEIGNFAKNRREFNLIIEIDGEELVDPANRPAVINVVKKIGYPSLTFLMKWPAEKGFDAELYRPLEQISTAGSNLAIECGTVRFSLLSDMWAWPYHQLMVDFSTLPAADEAIIWLTEIVMNMGEQLQVDTLAIGLSDKTAYDHSLAGGFEVGAGDHLGPCLTIQNLMAAVRPVNKKPVSEAEEDNQKAA